MQKITKMGNNFKFNVSLYQEIPSGVEDFNKLRHMAEERLKLYRIIKMHESPSAPEVERYLGNSPLRNLLQINDSPETMNARKIDLISHWILAVAYSTTDPQFFIENEILWFQLRFNSMSNEDRKKFWLENKIYFIEPSPEEEILLNLSRGKWVKIEFTKVINLVKLRLYPMKRGYIFIPEHKIVYCFLQKLERDLKQSLTEMKKVKLSWPQQLRDLLLTLDLVTPYTVNVPNALRLPDLQKQIKHFPLCMKIQHENLTKNNHLKHFSRVQYGLFLKSLGLPLDEALDMWKTEFTKKMSEGQFQKQYSYFFKHQYGTVGSKIDYSPQSCDTIINDSVGIGQVNGCPFKHWENQPLEDRLRVEIYRNKVSEIMELKSQQKCREACTLYFQCTHNYGTDLISHPTEYYERSCFSGLRDIEDLFVPVDSD